MSKRSRVSIITIIGLVILIVVFILYVSEKKEVNQPTAEQQLGKISQRTFTEDEIYTKLVNSVDMANFESILNPILVERAVGTPGHEDVKNYVIKQMKRLRWDVHLDEFEDHIPNGRKMKFSNIIATKNPSLSKFLVLACHYDSKLMDFVFIGATDSAVPCAMLMYLAQSLNNYLHKLSKDTSLKLIFFDGEEAFVEWSRTDSIYGARHLATQMERKITTVESGLGINDLNKIGLLVLLDLLGAPSPQFFSFFRNTNKWYSLLVSIQKRLLSMNLLRAETKDTPVLPYFRDEAHYSARIEDDHLPFLSRGVPVLHIIPIPFPEIWHTEYDNATAINLNTVHNLLAILKIFTVQYLAAASSI